MEWRAISTEVGPIEHAGPKIKVAFEPFELRPVFLKEMKIYSTVKIKHLISGMSGCVFLLKRYLL